MRKLLVSLAAAGTALAFATPAAAQYYTGQGYGGGYGYNGYGYNGYGYGLREQMRSELQQIRYQADNLARQGRLTPYEARDLFGDIHSAERALYRANNPWEQRELHERIVRIRHELRRYADYDGRRYGWNGYGYDHNGYYGDSDRYEREHERWHENHDGDRDDD